MTPITITINGQSVDGYFYASFAGIWVVHPASNGKDFSQVRGFTAEVQAAKLLRKLATRKRGPPLPDDAPEKDPELEAVRA